MGVEFKRGAFMSTKETRKGAVHAVKAVSTTKGKKAEAATSVIGGRAHRKQEVAEANKALLRAWKLISERRNAER